MLVQFDPIEPGDAASPQLWNQRFGLILSALNGQLDSDNLADGAVTTEKLADRSVTSAKLGFNKYTDANGWLITDLGLVKLASKERTFKTVSMGVGQVSFVTFDPGMDSNPVGFNPNAPYTMNWAISGDGNVGKWTFTLESGWAGNRAQPNSGVVQTQNTGGPEVRNFTMHTWVIF